MKILKLVAVAAFVATGASTAALAQDATGCSCVTQGVSAGQIGSFVSANGSVLSSGAGGYSPAAAGTPIAVGTEISVGANSSAQISVGSCALSLSENTVTRVSTLADSNICVAEQTVGQGSTGFAGNASYVPLGMFLTAGAVTGVLSLTDNDVGQGSDSVSP